MVVTIFEQGRERRTVRLEKNEANIGRAPGNDVVLADASVDDHHARLIHRDGRFIIVDLKSRRGTGVNGRRIAQATIVREGDRIRVGPYELRADTSDAPIAEDPPTDRDFEPWPELAGGDP